MQRLRNYNLLALNKKTTNTCTGTAHVQISKCVFGKASTLRPGIDKTKTKALMRKGPAAATFKSSMCVHQQHDSSKSLHMPFIARLSYAMLQTSDKNTFPILHACSIAYRSLHVPSPCTIAHIHNPAYATRTIFIQLSSLAG